jgi:hypothetical protein
MGLHLSSISTLLKGRTTIFERLAIGSQRTACLKKALRQPAHRRPRSVSFKATI